MKGVVPHLTIRDNRAAEAIDFYARAFGATESGRHMADDGKRVMHAHLDLNGGSLMLNDDFPEMMGGAAPPPAGVGLHSTWPMPMPRGQRRLRRARRCVSLSTTSSGASVTGRSPTRSAISGRSAGRSPDIPTPG